jgi:ABC-2 type transport system permease protein
LIDGFRYGFLGVSDGPIKIGIIIIFLINIFLFFSVLKVIKSGWRIKS